MQLVLVHRRIATAAGHITSRQLSPRYMTGATRSHARTVVREYCKGDDESQWEMGKFDLPPPKNPLNRWSPKFVYVTTSAISTIMQNFIQIGSGVSVLRIRDFAPLGKK